MESFKCSCQSLPHLDTASLNWVRRVSGSYCTMHQISLACEITSPTSQSTMKVFIQPYDPIWAAKFQEAKAALEGILVGVPYTSIEHVGSTSIIGMPAKPVLDIDIIVTLQTLPAVRAAMVKAGYLDNGEMGVPGRFVFRQPGYAQFDPASGHSADGEMRRNTYAMVEGCVSLKNHLDVRRILQEDEDLRKEYAFVKRELAGRDFLNMDEYTIGKNAVWVKIVKKAGWSEEEMEEVIKSNG